MGREADAFSIGDFWLSKRRDGKSPDIWQITTYSEKSRSDVYRSTKCRTIDLEAAKQVLIAHEAEARSKSRGQSADDSELLPHLFNYLREHGPDVKRLDTVKSSFRAWIGFLQQDDELDTGAVVADINKVSVARFRRWRMEPHSWAVEWNDKIYRHTSQGVTGEAVQRNIEDLRSALYHAQAAGRVTPHAIPSVDKHLRSQPADVVLDFKTLGAIYAYARQDVGIWREIALMMGTAARPGASMKFNPTTQWLGDIIDLHPVGEKRNDKRNAVVPAIKPLRPILEGWMAEPHKRVKSRKRWWRTARRVLGLPGEVEAYAIRHTIATYMDKEGVPGAQMSAIAGHLPSHRGIARTTSKHYLHYDPRNALKAVRVLTKFFTAVEREAEMWAADHLRTIPTRGKPIKLASNDENARISAE